MRGPGSRNSAACGSSAGGGNLATLRLAGHLYTTRANYAGRGWRRSGPRFKTTVPPPHCRDCSSCRCNRRCIVTVVTFKLISAIRCHSSGEPSSARPIAILSTSAADAFQRTTTLQAGSLSAGSRRHGAACPRAIRLRLWNSACNFKLKSLMRLMRRAREVPVEAKVMAIIMMANTRRRRMRGNCAVNMLS
jgi:hypothetical protein